MDILPDMRIGSSADVDACLALNHTCETDSVWHMTLNAPDPNRQVEIGFRVEKLPRKIILTHTPSLRHAQNFSDPHRLFMVVRPHVAPQPVMPVEPDAAEAPQPPPALPPRPPIIGYVIAHYDEVHRTVWVDDVCVADSVRRQKVARNLVDGVRLWADEKKAVGLLTAVTTKHAPMIALCQRVGMTFCGYNDRLFLNHDIAVLFALRLSRVRRVE